MHVAHRVVAAAVLLILSWASELAIAGEALRAATDRYYAIEVVDEQTGRGVPLVELAHRKQRELLDG